MEQASEDPTEVLINRRSSGLRFRLKFANEFLRRYGERLPERHCDVDFARLTRGGILRGGGTGSAAATKSAVSLHAIAERDVPDIVVIGDSGHSMEGRMGGHPEAATAGRNRKRLRGERKDKDEDKNESKDKDDEEAGTRNARHGGDKKDDAEQQERSKRRRKRDRIACTETGSDESGVRGRDDPTQAVAPAESSIDPRRDPRVIALYKEMGGSKSSGTACDLSLVTVPSGMAWSVESGDDGGERVRVEMPFRQIAEELRGVLEDAGVRVVDGESGVSPFTLRFLYGARKPFEEGGPVWLSGE